MRNVAFKTIVFKTKICLRCGKEYIPTSQVQKRCEVCRKQNRKETQKEYSRVYCAVNSDKLRAQHKEYYWERPEEMRAKGAQYRLEHPGDAQQYRDDHREEKKAWSASNYEANGNELREQHRLWLETPEGRASNQKSVCKRRTMGFSPLNQPFVGCEGHHVDNELVIYLPKTLHRSIWHRQTDGLGMAKINAVAYNYLFKQEVEAAMAAREETCYNSQILRS
jgi:isochorismate synthase EntC